MRAFHLAGNRALARAEMLTDSQLDVPYGTMNRKRIEKN